MSRTQVLIILVAAYLVKAYAMTATPSSLELSYFITHILIPHSIEGATPYGLLLRGIVNLWKMLPVDHPAVASFWTESTFSPSFSAYLLVFLVKLPILIVDIIVGATIFWYLRVRKPEAANFGLLLWALNPYVLVFNEMWGPVDLVPAALMFASVAMMQGKDRLGPSVASWILSVASKLFPLMILPAFLGINNIRSKRVRLCVFLVSGAIGVTLYAYWLMAAGYQPWITLREQGIVTQYFDEFYMSTIYVTTLYMEGSNHVLGLGTVALIIVSVLILEKWPRDPATLMDACIVILLTFFVFASWFPQFLLWVIPFLTVDIALRKRNILYTLVILSSATFISIIGFYYYITSNWTAFFFIPADSQFLQSAMQILGNFAQSELVTELGGPLARSAFSVTCLVYVLRVIEEKTHSISIIIRKVALVG